MEAVACQDCKKERDIQDLIVVSACADWNCCHKRVCNEGCKFSCKICSNFADAYVTVRKFSGYWCAHCVELFNIQGKCDEYIECSEFDMCRGCGYGMADVCCRATVNQYSTLCGGYIVCDECLKKPFDNNVYIIVVDDVTEKCGQWHGMTTREHRARYG